MEETFYQFGGAWQRDTLKIQALTKYNTLSLIDLSSTLVENNEFIVKQGKKLFDIIHFNDSQNIAISERMKRLLNDNKFIGWSSFEIKIQGINEKYYAFVNQSKAGPILNLEALNNYETDRTEFDIKTWNGSDIFHLENTLLNVCTSKVKEIITKAKLSNIEISLL